MPASAPARHLVLAGFETRPVRARRHRLVAEGDQPAGLRREQQPVRLRAAAVQVHRQLGPVQLGRQRLQLSGAGDAVQRPTHQLDQRGQRARRGQHDLGRRVRAPQGPVGGHRGQEIAQLERAQDDDPHGAPQVPSASSSDALVARPRYTSSVSAAMRDHE
jgi:hypothetical protein